MNKLGWVLLVVLVLMMGVAPAYAQDGNEIVIQPEGLVYTVIGVIITGIVGGGAWYFTLKGKKPAEDLDENTKNAMLGFLLIGGWLASKTPSEWDDQQLAKIMESIGLNKPVWNIPPTTEGENIVAQVNIHGGASDPTIDSVARMPGAQMAGNWGLKHKPAQSDPPPTDTRGMWSPTPLGDTLPDDEVQG